MKKIDFFMKNKFFDEDIMFYENTNFLYIPIKSCLGMVKVFYRKMKYLRFLCRQRCGFVSKLGHDSPALLTAITRNWYHFPSLSPGTLASNSSIVAEQVESSVTNASNQPPNRSFF